MNREFIRNLRKYKNRNGETKLVKNFNLKIHVQLRIVKWSRSLHTNEDLQRRTSRELITRG